MTIVLGVRLPRNVNIAVNGILSINASRSACGKTNQLI